VWLLAVIGAFSARLVVLVLVPVPDRATDNDALVALLATVSVPEAEPVAVGVNVTLAVHEAPAASDVPQLSVCANGPEAETDEMVAAAPPVLDTVTDCAAVVDPTTSLPKDSEPGDAVNVALPLELTVDIVTWLTMSGWLGVVTARRRSAPMFWAPSK
jgi:hypothetical protein